VVGVDGSLIGPFFFHCMVILEVMCEEEILYWWCGKCGL
jgi:hypothetical protein